MPLTLPDWYADAELREQHRRAWLDKKPFWETDAEQRARDSLARPGKHTLWTLFHLPLDEVEPVLFAGDVHSRFYAPEELAVRYLVATYGDRAFPLLEAWDYPDAYAMDELGDDDAPRRIVWNLWHADRHERALAWVEANRDRAASHLVGIAATRNERGLWCRDWVLAQPDVVDLLNDAQAAGVATGWARRLVRDPRFQPPPPVEGTGGGKIPPWWPPAKPATLSDTDYTALIDALESAPYFRHAGVAAQVAADPVWALGAGQSVFAAFVDDKAKPMYRWTLLAAAALGGAVVRRQILDAVPGWARSKNRNHRNHVGDVIRWIVNSEAISPLQPEELWALAFWKDTLKRDWQVEECDLALRWLARLRGTDVAGLLAVEPDLGLDGLSMQVDYGPRAFTVTFHPSGNSFTVTDEKGKTRARLPKPGKKDDADVAAASLERFQRTRTMLPFVVRMRP